MRTVSIYEQIQAVKTGYSVILLAVAKLFFSTNEKA